MWSGNGGFLFKFSFVTLFAYCSFFAARVNIPECCNVVFERSSLKAYDSFFQCDNMYRKIVCDFLKFGSGASLTLSESLVVNERNFKNFSKSFFKIM